MNLKKLLFDLDPRHLDNQPKAELGDGGSNMSRSWRVKKCK